MNTINFTARFLQKSQILKKDKDGNYEPHDISIVELDKNDSRDINALQKTAQKWIIQGGGYLAYNIYNDAVKKYDYTDVKNEHYLAATEQNSDYRNLDPNKILGLTLFSETSDSMNSHNELNFFEVEPITNSKSRFREYKRVGSALLNYIQDIYNQRPIYVVSDHNAINFYRKNNFKPIDDYDTCPFLIYKA